MFVAVIPPPEALAELEEFLAPRWEVENGPRWTRPESWHVTLAFYPGVPERGYEPLVENLSAAAPRTAPFDMAIAGGGAFPDPFRARVLWFGVQDATASLERLSGHCRTAAQRVGVQADGERFRPHLTAARTSRAENLLRWVEVLDTFAGLAWRVADVHLVESHLGEGPGGRPRYEVVESFPLGPSCGPGPGAPSGAAGGAVGDPGEESLSPAAALRAELGVGAGSVREALERRHGERRERP